MARPPRSSFDKNPLRLRLGALRRRLRMVVAVRGVGWLLTLLLLTVAGAGALDWAWHLPPLVRALILVGVLAGIGVVGMVYLLKPLLDRIDDLTLALRIEERYPSLNDSLASTIQFLEQAERAALLGETSNRNDSLAMRREAARRALQKAEGCDFNRVIDTRGFRAAGLSGLGAVAVVAILFFLFPASASTALKRLADPFGVHAWPSATILELEPHRQRIGRNEGFEIRGQVSGVIPKEVKIVYRLDDASPETHEYKIVKEEGKGHFLAQLRPGQMTRNFTFQVKANDAISEEFRVEVAPAPTFALLDGRATPQVQLFFPTYTDLAPRALPDGNGSIDAVAGTVVTLRAAANVPLQAAWLEYQPEPREVILAASFAPLGGANALTALTAGAVGLDIHGRHPARLSEDRKSFHLRFQPRVTGMYSIHIEDDTGLRSHRSYELRIRPDPAPTVTMERPSALKESLEVLPTARLPLRLMVEDPLFGIRSIWIEYRSRPDDPFRRMPLYTPEIVARDVMTAPLAWPAFGIQTARVKPIQYLIERPLLLSQIRHPDGASLREGDVVTLRGCADDYDNITVGKQPGMSSEVEIRIVSRPALDIALSREEERIQKELQEIRQMQFDATRKVTEIENRVSRTKKLSLDDQAELTRIEQAQQQIRDRLAAESQESVRSRVERLLETLKQNEVTRSATQERIEPVQRELERLAGEELRQIEEALTSTRRQAENPEDARSDARASALEQMAQRTERQARQLEQLAADKAREEADRERLTKESRDLRKQAERLRELARESRQDTKAQTPETEKRAQDRSKELERLAKEREELARQLEKNAARDNTGQERELLKQANEQKEAAHALREQAQAQLDQQKQDRGDLKASLTDARRRQEEVEKTLGDLLKNLESRSTTREVKNEARTLLEAQRRLNDEVEAMKKDNLGTDREKLTDEQKARLDNATTAQRKLGERMRELMEKMQRISEERKDIDPAAAQEMQEALEQARDGQIPARMKHAQEQLEQNQLGRASQEQKQALDELEKLVKKMEDRREAELDRAIKKMKEAEEKLDELARDQERLQKKVKEANKIEDPKKREEELQRLAREQKQLEEKTRQTAKELSRLQAQRASESLGQAAKQMEEAVRRLERGEPPVEQQEEALDRLDEAKEDVEKVRNNNEEELAREQLARVADVLKRLKERHDRLVSDLERLQKEVLEQKGWTRILAGSLSDLSVAEKGLAEEALSLAERELANAEVFARQLRRAIEAMKKSGDAFDEHVQRVKDEKANTEMPTEGQRFQKQAQRRLQMLVDALKMQEGQKLRPQGGANRGGGGGGGGGGSRGGAGDGIPPLAQLKLLRAMQEEVNEGTREFAKKHPDSAKLTEEEKKELEALQREQRAIADLIEEHTQPEKDEGEKK
jgi:hypothetical protein